MALLKQVWAFILRLFWIPRIDGLAAARGTFTLKLLRWYARFFLGAYLVLVPFILIQGMLTGEAVNLLPGLVGLLFFPLAYRLIMGFQLWFHTKL